MKSPTTQQGYTINEALVVIFVGSLLAVLVGVILIASNRVFQLTRASVDIQSELSRIQTLLQRDIRGAESVSEHPLGSPTYTSDSDTLVVRQPSIDAMDQVISTTYDYIIYSLSGSGPFTLTRQYVSNGAGRPSTTDTLSGNMTDVRFNYDTNPVTDATSVGAELTLTKSYNTVNRTLTTSLSAQLRN